MEQTTSWWESDSPATSASPGERWQTLQHSGPLFPADYKPHGIPLTYDGRDVALPPEAEEIVTCFCRYLDTDHVKNNTFRENFFKSFRDALPAVSRAVVADLAKCDFSKIKSHVDAKRELQRSRSATDRKNDKVGRDILKDKFGKMLVDGKEGGIGNFLIEPTGLFLGRGSHPKAGVWKPRIKPEDTSYFPSLPGFSSLNFLQFGRSQVTLNLDAAAPVPVPHRLNSDGIAVPMPDSHWKSVVHEKSVTWLATWRESVNESNKFVFPSINSCLFEAAHRDKWLKIQTLGPGSHHSFLLFLDPLPYAELQRLLGSASFVRKI